MSSRAHLVAHLLVMRLRELFLHALAGNPTSRPLVLVRQFEPDEVLLACAALDSASPRPDGRAIDVVVAGEAFSGAIVDFALAPGTTLTHVRNTTTAGAVLFQLQDVADKAGLGYFTTVPDSDLGLGGLSPDQASDRMAEIFVAGWVLNGFDEPPPGTVVQCLRKVAPELVERSLRSLCAFAGVVAERAGALSKPIDIPTAEALVGSELPAVGLFPDPSLFRWPSGVSRAVARNANYVARRSPTGGDAEPDDVVARISGTEIPGANGDAVGAAEAAAARDALTAYVTTTSAPLAATPFAHWEAVWREAQAQPLGTAIESELGGHECGGEAIPILLEADLLDRLNEGDQEGAAGFLELELGDGTLLVDLLSPPLQRRVHKAATPRRDLQDDPLRALLRFVQGGPDLTATELVLEADRRRPGGAATRWLFAFMYGGLLRSIAADSTSSRVRFSVDENLLKIGPCPFLPEQVAELTEEDEGGGGPDWAPLNLALCEAAPGGGPVLHQFEWAPDSIVALAVLPRIILTEEPIPFPLVIGSFAEWAADLANGGTVPIAAGPMVDGGWAADRQAALADLAEGISIPALERAYDAWIECAETRTSASGPLLSGFLDHDVVLANDAGEQRPWLLSSHPLRLRWLANHFRRMAKELSAALDGTLVLNGENEEFFFQRLARVSPHRQPPFMVYRESNKDVPATSVRELALCEEFAPFRGSDHGSAAWTSGMDDESIKQLEAVARQYLSAFPYKTDGLNVLLVDRSGDPDAAARLVRRLSNLRSPGTGSGLASLRLHILAPEVQHSGLARALELEDGAYGRGGSALPRVSVVLHPLEQAEDCLRGMEGAMDIAFVPDLFRASTGIVAKTGAAVANGPGFDAWLDPASYVPPHAAAGDHIAHQLRPRGPDRGLEAWSTLGVRRKQLGPVGDVDDVDYFEVQVQYSNEGVLFQQLHDAAQWVVTLDPFVGREQVDALPDTTRPDVILVKAGVGKNDAYTMVISSRSGRDLVTQRLAVQLRDRLGIPPGRAGFAAKRIFDVGKRALPALFLRAIGLGRSTEEILGLVAARYAVERGFPPPERPHLEWWIPLDQQLEWFGGAKSPRADLLRVVIEEPNSDQPQPRMTMTVVESKYRRVITGPETAPKQLAKSVSLIEQAFRSGPEQPADGGDRPFWRRELLQLFDQASRSQDDDEDLPEMALRGISDSAADEMVRQALTSGEYELVVRAAAVFTQVEEGPVAPPAVPDADVLTVPRSDLLEIIGAIEERRAPVSAGAAGTRPDPTLAVPAGVVLHPPSASATTRATASPEPEPAHQATPIAEASEGLGEEELGARAQRVTDALASNGISVSPAPDGFAAEGPSFFLLRFVPGPGVTVDRVLARHADAKLALGLPADRELRAYVDRGAVVFEVPKADEERSPVPADAVWARVESWPTDRLWVPLGVDIAGEVVAIDFSAASSPHLLIGGTTGSGKSVALETLLLGLTQAYGPSQLALSLIDPKGTELLAFEDVPHLVGPIGMDDADAIAMLDAAVSEMDERYMKFKEVRARSLPQYNATRGDQTTLPWHVIVLDEYADLTADAASKKEIEALLQRLAQKARAAGIHVIVATQRPTADVIGTTIRSNLPAQLALRVRSGTESRVLIDEVGAEALAGRGDALLRTAEGVVRLQCAMPAPAS